MKDKHQVKSLKYMRNPFFIGGVFIFFTFLVSGGIFLVQVYSMLTAPSQKVKAVVDSNFLEPGLFGHKYSVTLRSNKLPRGEAVIDVLPMEYAAVSGGNATCVQFKSTPEYPQYKEKFLFPWDCAGAK